MSKNGPLRLINEDEGGTVDWLSGLFLWVEMFLSPTLNIHMVPPK